jgi:hypothetical protein
MKDVARSGKVRPDSIKAHLEPQRSNVMNAFVQQHAKLVSGMISGWDRLRFRGTLRQLCHAEGLNCFLHVTGRLFKQFKEFALSSSTELKQAALAVAERLSRPVIYLPSARISKEEVARQCAKDEGITEGLICAISAVEPCSSFVIRRNKATGRFGFERAGRKCQHIYHYYQHPVFGFMHVRLQTWLPFDQFICINGREWLSRQLDAAKVKYLRKENCFLRLDDVQAAQRMLDEQVGFDWRPALDQLAESVAPTLRQLLEPFATSYYWTITESEWASDLMFNRTRDLSNLYPSLLHHGISSFGSREIMRFLGQKVPLHGNAFPNQKCQFVSDQRGRAEGIRIKHRMGSNSVKMYNKQGSVLRVETTLNDVSELKSPRRREGGTQGSTEDGSQDGTEGGTVVWMQMRKGVVDARQRAAVSQTANQRYLDAIATVSAPITLASVTASLSDPVVWNKQRIRGLNLLHEPDAQLLQAVSRGEFLIHGLRNRDLQAIFHPDDPTEDVKEKRRRSAKIGRKIRMLRAHGLLSKLPNTHRYVVSDKGRRVITALLAIRQTDIAKLPQAA